MKNLFLLTICLVVFMQSCKKENLAINGNQTSDNKAFLSNAEKKTYVKAIQPYNDSIIGGDSFPITVVLNKPAPVGGFKAYINTVRYTGPIADVPSYITIPQGQLTGTISVHSIPVRDYEIELFLAGPASSDLDLQYLISFLPRPENDPRQLTQFLEAENAVLQGAHAVSGNDAFSNGGFAQYDKAKGGSVTFNFSVKKTGSYFLVLKYATPSNEGLQNNVLKIQLNSKAVNAAFPFTASENSTQILNFIELLKTGTNKVTVTSVGKGIERLDYLEIAAQ